MQHLFTVRKRSLGQGNIFAPVCHSVHRGGAWAGTPPGKYSPRQVVHAGRYGQQAGGTHPTGMHSCSIIGMDGDSRVVEINLT